MTRKQNNGQQPTRRRRRNNAADVPPSIENSAVNEESIPAWHEDTLSTVPDDMAGDLEGMREDEFFEKFREEAIASGIPQEDVQDAYDSYSREVAESEAAAHADEDRMEMESASADIPVVHSHNQYIAPVEYPFSSETEERNEDACNAAHLEEARVSVTDMIRARQNGTANKPTADAGDKITNGSMLKSIIASRKPQENKITASEEIRNRLSGRKSGSSVSKIIFERRYRRG